MFGGLLTASDWLKYTHNLSNTTKLILLDSLLQDDTAGAIIRVVFFLSTELSVQAAVTVILYLLLLVNSKISAVNQNAS